MENDLTEFLNKVYEVRGQRVMIDFDIAVALQVTTKYLNENAQESQKWKFLRKQNIEDQYRFCLTEEEYNDLKLRQFKAVANSIANYSNKSRYLPWVYTQKGCAFFGTSMSNVKACELAIKLANVYIHYLNKTNKKIFELDNDRIEEDLNIKDDPILASLIAIGEMRKKQLRLVSEVRVIQKLEAETRNEVKAIQKRIDNMNGDTGYSTVLAYTNNHNFNLPVELARRIGKMATMICKEKDIEIGSVPDERWGSVNSYPRSILDEVVEILKCEE